MENLTLDKFVESCLEKGISSITDMRKAAQDLVIEIDKELEKAIALRKKKQDLLLIIKDFSSKKEKQSTQPSEDYDLSDNLTSSILELIKKTDKCSARSMIEMLGLSNEDPSPMYSRLKILQEKELIERNKDREFVKGKKWI